LEDNLDHTTVSVEAVQPQRSGQCVLVLGIGNLLLSDDGVGIHVVNRLLDDMRKGRLPKNVVIRDGGTIGLTLLSELDANTAIIAVDAMELEARPGTVSLFEGAEMDRQLTGRKKTAHEVALSDLMQAAQLCGCFPDRRALVAIQPGSIEWGMEPTTPVSGAVAVAADRITALIRKWQHE
jgi:hydrogenase maturation protease